MAEDFNVISSVDERVSGHASRSKDMEEFNDTLMHAGLSSLTFDRLPFTWTNERVWQRLDRVVINDAWFEVFPILRVSHLVKEMSNHRHLFVRCGDLLQQHAAFRFQNI